MMLGKLREKSEGCSGARDKKGNENDGTEGKLLNVHVWR